MSMLRGLLGVLVILGVALLFSRDRRRVPWPLVGKGLLLQLGFGALVLRGADLAALWGPLGWPRDAFFVLSRGFVRLLGFTTEGAVFVFGPLARAPGEPGSLGFFFVFQVLPTIIFFSTLMSVLYHLGVMQRVVQALAWLMVRVLGTSGAETLSTSADIFVGQIEAPLMVRPYLATLTESELHTVMVGGLATIAGGVMAAYVQMLGGAFAAAHGVPLGEAQVQFAAQLLGASIMAAPAALLVSKVLLPETGNPETGAHARLPRERPAANLIDAAATGASDGMKLAITVTAMLLAFIALIAFGNYLLGLLGGVGHANDWLRAHTGRPLSFELIFGFLFQGVACAIGVPWNECFHVGGLLGVKVTLNEFVAYAQMADLIRTGALHSTKAITMAAFALCGFANFASVGMLIGGLGALAPGRRADISRLGLRALLGGTLATLLTATLAGVLVGG